MKIHALYFGGLRARLGLSESDLDLPAGSLVRDAARLVCEPLGSEWSGALRMAVNEELVTGAWALKEGDQVAFLPPVSGG